MQQFYTITDLKTHLHCSRSKIYEIVAEGLAPTIYIGTSPRWSDETITDWLAKQSIKITTKSQKNNPAS